MTATPQHCQCNGGKMLTLTPHRATCLQPCVRVPPHAPFLVVGECGLGSAHSPTTLSPPLFFQLLVYCYYATLTTNERDRRTPTTTTRRRDEAPKCRKRNTRFQEAKLTTPGGKGRHPIWLWRTRPPLPATPILGVATLKHGGGALIFKTPKNFMHFGTLGTYHFFSRFLTFFNPGPHWSVRSLLTREVGGPRQPRPELPSDLRGAPPGASFVAVGDCGLGSSHCPTPSPPLSNFQERSGTVLEV